VQDKHMITTDH